MVVTILCLYSTDKKKFYIYKHRRLNPLGTKYVNGYNII